MYFLKGDKKKVLQSIFVLYSISTLLNVFLFTRLSQYSIFTAFKLQHAIFIACFIMVVSLVRDKNYTVDFGRMDDYRFIIAVKTLMWMSISIAALGIFYITPKVGEGEALQILQYGVILSVNIVFSQEISSLIFRSAKK